MGGSAPQGIQQLAGRIADAIVNPLIVLVIAIGLLVFVWGLVEYLYELNVRGGKPGGKGKDHMIWGLVGMFIMVSALSIIKVISNVVGGQLPPGY